MELKDYIDLIGRNWIFLAVFILLGAVLGFTFSAKLPTGYSQSQLFFLTSSTPNQTTEPSPYPGQTNYYLEESARNFTDTAVVILESPDFANDAHIPAGSISARKLAAQAIRLTATGANADEAKDSLTKAGQTFNKEMNSNQPFQLKSVGTNIQSSKIVYSKKILAAAGALIGAIFAILVIAAKSYFKL